MRNCKKHWQHCISCHLLLHIGLIPIPCSQSIATVNNCFMQYHFPLLLGSFEKNIVVNNFNVWIFKKYYMCLWLFPLKLLWSHHRGKKKEVLVGENSLQKSCISAFCTYLLWCICNKTILFFCIAYQNIELVVITVVSNKKIFQKWQQWNRTPTMLQNTLFVS